MNAQIGRESSNAVSRVGRIMLGTRRIPMSAVDSVGNTTTEVAPQAITLTSANIKFRAMPNLASRWVDNQIIGR